jgi:hypothetical protein
MYVWIGILYAEDDRGYWKKRKKNVVTSQEPSLNAFLDSSMA